MICPHMRVPIRILCLGGHSAVYRPGLWLGFFAGRPDKYRVSYLPPYLNKGRFDLDRIFVFLSQVFSLLACDWVFVMPMTHNVRLVAFLVRLAKALKKNVVVDYYISGYESAVLERKRFKTEHRNAHALLKSDKFAIQSSDLTIFLNKAEAVHYTELGGIDLNHIHYAVVPLTSPKRPQARLPFANRRAEMPTIAWWGALGNPLHGIEVILETVRLLCRDGYRAKFKICGTKGTDFEALKQKFPELVGHPDVLLTDEYSFSNGKLTSLIRNEVDFALGVFGDTQKARTVVVNKVIDAAAFGIPSITIKSHGMAEFFTHGDNIIYSENTTDALQETVRKYCGERENSKLLGRGANKVYTEFFSPQSFEQMVSRTSFFG